MVMQGPQRKMRGPYGHGRLRWIGLKGRDMEGGILDKMINVTIISHYEEL